MRAREVDVSEISTEDLQVVIIAVFGELARRRGRDPVDEVLDFMHKVYEFEVRRQAESN